MHHRPAVDGDGPNTRWDAWTGLERCDYAGRPGLPIGERLDQLRRRLRISEGELDTAG